MTGTAQPATPADATASAGPTVPDAAARQANRTSMVVLILAEGISLLGTGSARSPCWLVLITTHNPVRTGIVAGAATVRYILNGFVAAPLVDRVGARRMSILTDVFSACAMSTLIELSELRRASPGG